MAIVISPDVQLVVATADTTDFDTNDATDIPILRGATLSRNTKFTKISQTRVDSSSNRAMKQINSGFEPTFFTFSSYIQGGKVSSVLNPPEKLLWESLFATDSLALASTFRVRPTDSDINQLRELFFYIVYEDGSYYKISNAVVANVEIDLSINQICKATWTIIGLDLDYISGGGLTGTPIELDTKFFYRNKLGQITLKESAGDNTQLAIIGGRFFVNNTVRMIMNEQIGEPLMPIGHRVSDIDIGMELDFYLNTKIEGSYTVLNNLSNYATLDDLNTLWVCAVTLGGVPNASRLSISGSYAKVTLREPTIGIKNTVSVSMSFQESGVGTNDQITVQYYNTG